MSNESREFPIGAALHASVLELEAMGLLTFKEPDLIGLTEAGEDRAADILLGMPLSDTLLVSLYANESMQNAAKEVKRSDGQDKG